MRVGLEIPGAPSASAKGRTKLGAGVIRARGGPRGPFERELSTRIRDLLSPTDRATSSTEVLRQFLDVAVEITEAERAFLLLLEDAQERILVSRTCDREDVQNPEGKVSRSVASACLRSGQAVVITNAKSNWRFLGEPGAGGPRMGSVLCIPLKDGDGVIGTIYLDNRFRSFAFGQREVELVEGLARLVSLTIGRHRSRRIARRQPSSAETMKEPVSAPAVGGHLIPVSEARTRGFLGLA